MTQDTFLLLRSLELADVENGRFGFVQDIFVNMRFPVDSDFYLRGYHLYHWRKSDDAQLWPYVCYLTIDVIDKDEKIDFYTLE